MPELFVYLLKINLAVALFYLGYFFFLKKLTFYSLNRVYLLFALVLSAAFPFIKLPAVFSKPAVTAYSLDELGASLVFIPQVEEKQSMVWLGLSILYWLGMIFGTVRVFTGLVSLYRIHIQSVPDHWKGYSFRNLSVELAPFSFLGTIYLNKGMHSDQELNTVLKHELEHTKGLHSLDVLLIELWSIFSWFNPLTYFIKKAIKVNIEFIADREVVTRGVPQAQYQTNLIRFATKSGYIPLVNQFSFLSLKSRIMMMNKKKSSKRQLSKYVLLIPGIIGMLFIFGFSKAYEGSTLVDLPDQRPLETKRTVEDKNSMLVKGERAASQTKEEKTTRDSTLKLSENPLYVIDGVVQEGQLGEKNVANITPDHIKSISILKGESATSLYGEKGKGGVILIVTKNVAAVNSEEKSVKRESGSATNVTIRSKAAEGKDTINIVETDPFRVIGVAGHATIKQEGNAVGIMTGDSTTSLYGGKGS